MTSAQPTETGVTTLQLTPQQRQLLRRSVFVLKRHIQAQQKADSVKVSELNALDQMLLDTQDKEGSLSAVS